MIKVMTKLCVNAKVDFKNGMENYQVLRKDLARRGYGAVIKYGLAYASVNRDFLSL